MSRSGGQSFVSRSRFTGFKVALLSGIFALGSTAAMADEVLVVPLIASNLKSGDANNITSLVAWELEFAGDFDMVNQIDNKPSSLNPRCLSSSSCLGGIARANGASAMVAGAATGKGGKVDLYLVLWRDGKIERSKEYTAQNDSSVLADSMGGFVGELLSGASPTAEADAAVIGGDLVADADMFGDEEDDFDDFGSSSRRIPTPSSGGSNELDDFDMLDDGEAERQAEEAARRRAEEESRRRAEEESRRRAEEESRRQAEEESRRRAEEESRRRAEEESRRRAEEESRRRAEEEAAREAEDADRRRAEREAAYADENNSGGDDLDGFSFGSGDASSDDLSFGSTDDDDELDFSSDRQDYDSGYSSSRSPSRSSTYDDLDEDWDSDDDRGSRNSNRSNDRKSSRSNDTSSRTRVEHSSSDSSASLAMRMGYSSFQELGFVTYGAEATFKPIENIGVVVGIEAYSTQREIPEPLLSEGEPEVQWNTILPFNVGAQYLMGSGGVQPYAGADLQFIPGYVKDVGGLALGLRARGGVNFLMSDSFGLNLNLSAGFWSGKNFETVAKDFTNAAMVPQVSAGAVVLF